MSSEHRVSTTDRSTVNTAEYSGVLWSTSTCLSVLGDKNAFSASRQVDVDQNRRRADGRHVRNLRVRQPLLRDPARFWVLWRHVREEVADGQLRRRACSRPDVACGRALSCRSKWSVYTWALISAHLLHLGSTSAPPRLHLGSTSATSRLHLGSRRAVRYVVPQQVVGLGDVDVPLDDALPELLHVDEEEHAPRPVDDREPARDVVPSLGHLHHKRKVGVWTRYRAAHSRASAWIQGVRTQRIPLNAVECS